MKKKTVKTVAWKKTIILLSIIGIISAIAAQILFNIDTNKRLNEIETYVTRELINDSIDGITSLKDSPNQEGKIIESNLYIPKGSISNENLLYLVTEHSDERTPYIQITSKGLTRESKRFLDSTSVSTIVESSPLAQACTRGFTIEFIGSENQHPDAPLSRVTTKTLKDGRQINILRETQCSSTQMDELEQILVNIESY